MKIQRVNHHTTRPQYILTFDANFVVKFLMAYLLSWSIPVMNSCLEELDYDDSNKIKILLNEKQVEK